MLKFAIVNLENIVENIIIWDGVEPWGPCHESDRVILISGNDPVIGEPFVD